MKWLIAALGLWVGSWPAAAQVDPEQETKAAFEAAKKTMQPGPTDIKLTDQGTLHLPKGFVFVPQNEALRILRSMGNSPSQDLLGMIFPQEGDSNWFMTARYIKSGYIKDDDARDWNADDLLKNLREGTEAGNDERTKRGIPAIEVVGWVQSPTYDATGHRLVWSASTRPKGAPQGGEQGVNYNTYLLGREGYVSMNLVTDLKTVESEKPIAKQLLAAVEFDKGKTYGEFNASTDHIAEYGLAALVGGVAMKKLGLFAVIAAFFVKFAKIIILALVPLGAWIMKFFRREKKPVVQAPPTSPPGT